MLPPPVVLDDSDDGDGSDDNDGDGGDDGAVRISQRLTRGNRGVRVSAQGSGDAVPGAPVSKPVNMPPDWPPVPTPRGPAPASPKPPDTPAPGNASAAAMACHRLGIDPALATGKGDKFIVYLGSGRDRPGSVREHAAKNHLIVVMIDKKVGGYEHDISYAPVVAALVDLVQLPNCKGVLARYLAVRGRCFVTFDRALQCYGVSRAQTTDGPTKHWASNEPTALYLTPSSAQI